MKKLLYCLVAVQLVSCTAYIPFSYKGYETGVVYTTSVGSTMLFRESGLKKSVERKDSTADEDPLTSNTIQQGYRYELVYAGINHNVIQVLYREYVVRFRQTFFEPAFSQIFQYDINENKTITFQRYKIEIIDANSEFVKFKLISD